VKLVDALSDFVRVEAKREVKAEAKAPIGTRPILVLLILAVNTALFLSLVEELFHHPVASLVSKIVPFLFGATFIALLDDVRKHLFALCNKKMFTGAVIFSSAVLGYVTWLSSVPVTVPINTSSVARMFVDDREHPRSWEQKGIEIPLRGVHGHIVSRVEILDTATQAEYSLDDSITVGLLDRLRATLPARTLLGDRVLDLTTSYPVVVFFDSPPTGSPKINAIGRFPPGYPKRFKRHRLYEVRLFESAADRERRDSRLQPRDSARLSRRFAPGSESVSLSLPEGSYMLTIEDGKCSRGPVRVEVKPQLNAIDATSLLCQR
jgi:hypothetical protein